MGVIHSQLAGQALKPTPAVDRLLSQIAKELEVLVADNATEAQISFKTPLKWTTQLSEDKLPETVEKVEGVVSVDTLRSLLQILAVAGADQVEELRQVIAANPDPAANILGSAYGNGANLKAVTEPEDEDETFINLVHVLHVADVKLQQANGATQPSVPDDKVTMSAAEAELETLKSYAGPEDEDCLDSIDWENAYTFSNGVRAPPWRREHGDLGYIICKPRDAEGCFIVVNKEGFWRAKSSEEDARIGQTYTSLTALLKGVSPHFADTIENQPSKQQTRRATVAALIPDTSSLSNTKRGGPSAAAKGAQRRRVLQPSPRWANLGLTIAAPADGMLTSRSSFVRHSSHASATDKRSAAGKRNKGISRNASSTLQAHASRTVSAMLPRRTLEPIRPVEEFSESEDDLDEVELDERPLKDQELPSEYWAVQKLVKYLAGGNETATLISLCLLRDMNPASPECQYALRHGDGLDVLVNLLDTEDVKCRIGALEILKDASRDYFVKRDVANMNGVRPLVQLLDDENDEIKVNAALTLANCAENPRNRRMVRFYGGIGRGVALLRQGLEQDKHDVARAGAQMLWMCSKSSKNKEHILSAGAVDLLAQLLQSDNVELLVPVVGVLQECASHPTYRNLIRKYRLIPFLVENLRKQNGSLQAHSAMTIFKCAEDAATQALVRECDGLAPLVALLQGSSDQHLLEGASGAIWKCAADPQNVKRFSELKAVDALVGLLKNGDEVVLTNVAGALAALAVNPDSCKSIRTTGGIEPLVKLLTSTNYELLINATRAVGAAAASKENMDVIDKLDGVRLLWSLLKSENINVVASAAWAIGPCIENARDAGALVRSFVGGVELVVGLLKSEHLEVVAAVCAAVAQIAKDEENLAVITDHAVVPLLCDLVDTKEDLLREHLAAAIANCCSFGNNRISFGEYGAVAPLAKFLRSKNDGVRGQTARALHELSKDAENCIVMHNANVVPHLLDLVGSKSNDVAEVSACCLANLRRLALCNELNNYS